MFLSFNTLCQPLSSPHLHSLCWCLPQFSCLLLPPSLLFFLCLTACLFSPLYSLPSPHLLLICHFPLSILPVFPPSSFLLSSFVSLSRFCLFLHVILWHNILPFMSVFFLCFLSISAGFPPAGPARSILVVYFLSLKPWRWIIEQTDPWLHSCCLGVVCVFSLIPFQYFKCLWSCFSLYVFLNNWSASVYCMHLVFVVSVCAFCAVFTC